MMEMNWSRWFRCESSFELLLVPNQPGVFAVAEEVVQPAGPQSRRMLAVFEVQETEDLACSLSRMFAAGSEWREKLTEARCYVRYAVVPSIPDRRAAAGALKTWLNSHREVAAQVFEHKVVTAATTVNAGEMRSERRNARAEHEGGVPSKPAVGLMGCDGGAAQRCGALEETELKTVAETAVDRVTHGIQWSRQSAVEV
jgi:hypothetical protein